MATSLDEVTPAAPVFRSSASLQDEAEGQVTSFIAQNDRGQTAREVRD